MLTVSFGQLWRLQRWQRPTIVFAELLILIRLEIKSHSGFFRAPDDCLQYHTGNSGGFKSFNFDNGQVLSSQNYRICIRQEIGKGHGSAVW